MPHRVLSAVFAVAWLTANAAQADLIVAYESEYSFTPLPAGAAGAGVTGAPLARGPGLTETSGSTFRSEGWTTGGTKADAIAAGDFLTWGFASAVPYDFTDFSIQYGRSFAGPGVMAIDLAVNGGSFTQVFSDPAVSPDGETVSGIDLSAYQDVTSATFRLYGWGSLLSSGWFEVTNGFDVEGTSYAIVVNGNAAEPAAVPEPGSVLLLVLSGLAGAGGLLRRRGAAGN
ncbi:PEP-CTERM sorting domain-containing protein [Alienimonas sp. DA493]|uniref:PEP-CTERM sorting domain-containing protein n=1 Tax=Alienimonas sp. DA493 TaxID=3373605 RepID=UPI003754E96A